MEFHPGSNYWRSSGSDDDEPTYTKPSARSAMQQDLTVKYFFDYITKGGLGYAYAMTNNLNPKQHYQKMTKHKKHVIIVGAGTSGLSAAYELRQSGHKVTILEFQHRVGGRTKTIGHPFARGLHAEGGAMRLPPTHYLTKHYIEQFKVPTRPFQNVNKNGFMCFYGDKVKMSDWDANAGWYCTKYWPGWDADLTPEMKAKFNITGINSYFKATVGPVKDELQQDHSAEGWAAWVKKWSNMSVLEFLQTNINPTMNGPQLRPWPQEAVKAYVARNYMPMLNGSLVEFLREEVGKWWVDPLYTPKDGIETLAWAFTEKNVNGWNHDVELMKDVRFGVKVEKIDEMIGANGKRIVKVLARNQTTKREESFEGDAVIITVPLTVLRQMQTSMSIKKQQAIRGIYYEPSTKILLQCKTRFWQKPDNLQGGFSKTNLPIGQVHYPDWEQSGIPVSSRGILVVYTWAQEAEMFGAQTTEQAIDNAVRQVATIHPEIMENFEVGAVQAWFNEPSAQGAFVFLRPHQYNDNMKILQTPEHPIYLAGEALSWSNGWIQGAIESGLRAAYQFYDHNEKQYPPEPARTCQCSGHIHHLPSTLTTCDKPYKQEEIFGHSPY